MSFLFFFFRSSFLIAAIVVGFASAVVAKPIIIAHRGASGYLPEHTIAAYTMAIEMGADFIEPDVVSTKDGVLIVRHENELSDTTDVAAKFPDRKSKRNIDGQEVEGWFSEDFTLAEIKTLRAKERVASRNQSNNGKYEIPTLDEVLALVTTESTKRNRMIGVYPETKHPTHFASRGLALEEPLLKALKAAGRDRAASAVFIQSFEVSNLQRLKTLTSLPLVQLLGEPNDRPFDQQVAGKPLTYANMATDDGFRAMAAYAKGVGPYKAYIIQTDTDGKASSVSDFVTRAHKAGLVVHPYTFRSDAQFLAKIYGGDPVAEYCAFFAQGIDGLFSDFSDTALKARDKSCPMGQ
jgi:glycerophosphoryl diester phosphodiesterase